MDQLLGSTPRPQEEGGELVRLDWRTKKVRARVPIIPTDPHLVDPNPRGNTRGGRGIELTSERVLVCSYHTLKIFNRELKHLRDVSHHLMVGLHETCRSRVGRVWVTSTAIDAAFEIDLGNGEVTHALWPRELERFRRGLGLVPLEIDKAADNRGRFLDSTHVKHPSHLHLNAVAHWCGEIYCLFNKFGIIANVSGGEIVVQDSELRGGHNLLITPEGTAIVNDTRGQTVRFYDMNARRLQQVIDLMQYRWVRRLLSRHMWRALPRRVVERMGLASRVIAKPLFVRGLDKVGDLVFVGLSPASILCVDATTNHLVDAYQYSSDVNACVHGLCVARDADDRI